MEVRGTLHTPFQVHPRVVVIFHDSLLDPVDHGLTVLPLLPPEEAVSLDVTRAGVGLAVLSALSIGSTPVLAAPAAHGLIVLRTQAHRPAGVVLPPINIHREGNRVLAQPWCDLPRAADCKPQKHGRAAAWYASHLHLNLHPDAADEPRAIAAVRPGDHVAHGVNFSNLLSDAEYQDWDALDQHDIQTVLERDHSALAQYAESGHRASDIIAAAAARYKINPMVILVTLEKEEGLLSSRGPLSPTRLRAAMGYAYTDSGGRPDHSCFTTQVQKGTAALRRLFDEAHGGPFPRHQEVDYGQHTIQIDNAATWALMRYTPHTVDTHLPGVGGGNYLFSQAFKRISAFVSSILP